MEERKKGIGKDINCLQGERKHGHSDPGCFQLHWLEVIGIGESD
jgi:hypothetical protein